VQSSQSLINLIFLICMFLVNVSILASFCVWTKSLICKDTVNRDSTIQSDVRRFCLQVRRNPSSLSAVRTIEPFRPDTPLFTVPSVQTTCHPVRTPDKPVSSVRTTCSFRPDPYTVSRSFCSSLYPSGRFSSTSGFLSVLERFSDSFQVPRKG
jgi:hypothetical protein